MQTLGASVMYIGNILCECLTLLANGSDPVMISPYTIEVKKAHPGPKAMRITVIHAVCNSRVVFEQLNCRGGMGLCMPIEVFRSSASVRAYNFVKVIACSAHRSS